MMHPGLQVPLAEIVVGVGDCRLGGRPAEALATYALGSCIAVVAWDWKLRMGGMLHVMLPDSSIDRATSGVCPNPFLYVDTGLPEMVRHLEVRGAVRARLRCSMAGGANMMADSTSFEIGKRNHLALKRAFWKLGMFVDCEDIGGHESRSVRLDLQSGRVDLRKGIGAKKVLVPARVELGEGAGR